MKSRDNTRGIWNPETTLQEYEIPGRHYRNMKSRGNTTGIWISMTTLQEYEFPWQHYRNMKSRHNTTGIRIPWQHYSKGIEMQAGDATAGARSGRRSGGGGGGQTGTKAKMSQHSFSVLSTWLTAPGSRDLSPHLDFIWFQQEKLFWCF